MRNFTAKEKIKLEKFYINRPILEDYMTRLYAHEEVEARIKQIQAERRKIRKETGVFILPQNPQCRSY